MKALEGKNPHMCACVGWCVRLEVLSPLVSDCFPTICVCVGWCVRLPKSPFVVFHCLPSPFLFPFLEWCARLFEVLSPLVTHCFPVSPIVSPPVCTAPCVGWCVRLLEVLAPIVSHGLLKWCVRLPDVLFRIVSHCPHICACVGWCVRLPEVLSPLVSLLVYSILVSGCLHVFPIVPLSPSVSHGPPSQSLVFHCLPLSPQICVLVLDGVSALDHIRLQDALYPIVSPHVCLCWMLCPPSRGLVPTCDLCWMVCPLSRGLVSPLSPLVSLLVSLCWIGWCVRLPEVFSPLSPSLSPGLFPSCLPACLQLVSQLVFLLVSLCGGGV